jgi:spermidine synthase
LIGFTAVTAQVFFLRELLVLFQGNELSLGFSFSAWLIWTAIGSFASGGISIRSVNLQCSLALLFWLEAFFSPLTLLGIRLIRPVLPLLPGEMLGPGWMLLISFVSLGPFCLCSGALFTIASRKLAYLEESPANSTSTVYLWEAVGSGIAGLISSFVLVRVLTPLQIVFILSIFGLAAGLFFFSPARSRKSVVASLAIGLASSIYIGPPLERWSEAARWHGFELIDFLDTPFSRLSLIGYETSQSICVDGVVAETMPDRERAEELVHFALLEHPKPESLLLIGGGLAGGLHEALKHSSLRRIDYLELDPQIIEMVKGRWKETAEVFESPKIRIHNLDGRFFLKRTDNRYDVIICAVPEPLTLQLNRFYTREFFREVAGSLLPGGVYSFSVVGADNFISDKLALFLRIIRDTLMEEFRQVVVLPGPRIHFFGTNETGVLSSNADRMILRLEERGIETQFVNADFLPFRFSPDRLGELERALESEVKIVNLDFHPSALRAGSQLWFSQFDDSAFRLASYLGEIEFHHLLFILAFSLGLISLKFIFAEHGSIRNCAAFFCLLTVGVISISLQLILLLGFQLIFGYVYSQLILIISFSMLGIGLGSWISLRCQRKIPLLKAMIVLAAGSIAAPYTLVQGLEWIAEWGVTPLLAGNVLFPLLGFLSGILGGLQFPLASRLFFENSPKRNLGTLYAADLLGAFAASLLLSGWWIPVYGLFKSAILAGATGLSALILLLGLLKFRSEAADSGSPA